MLGAVKEGGLWPGDSVAGFWYSHGRFEVEGYFGRCLTSELLSDLISYTYLVSEVSTAFQSFLGDRVVVASGFFDC